MENEQSKEVTQANCFYINSEMTSKSASLIENSIYNDLENLTRQGSGNIFISCSNKYQTELIINRIERDNENKINYRLVEFKNIAINCLGLQKSCLENFTTYHQLTSDFDQENMLEKNLVGQESFVDLLDDTIIIFSISSSELTKKDLQLLEDFYSELIDKLIQKSSGNYSSRYLLFPTKKLDLDFFVSKNRAFDKIVIQSEKLVFKGGCHVKE